MNFYKELSKQSYRISIPSRGRSFLISKKAGVWKYFNSNLPKYPLKIYVREEDIKEYESVVNGFFDIITVPNEFTIADKREQMIQDCHKDGVEVLFMMDDDISFYSREENMLSKYVCRQDFILENKIIDKLLYECVKLCDKDYPCIGVPNKMGSTWKKYLFEKNTPVLDFVGYHVPTLIKENIHGNGLGLPVKEDTWLHVSVLEKGYVSLTNCNFAISGLGRGYKGGCRLTRTVDQDNESAKKFHKCFPNHTKLKIKQDSHSNYYEDNNYNQRLYCQILWKKFLKENELKYLPKEEGLKKIYGEDYDTKTK